MRGPGSGLLSDQTQDYTGASPGGYWPLDLLPVSPLSADGPGERAAAGAQGVARLLNMALKALGADPLELFEIHRFDGVSRPERASTRLIDHGAQLLRIHSSSVFGERG